MTDETIKQSATRSPSPTLTLHVPPRRTRSHHRPLRDVQVGFVVTSEIAEVVRANMITHLDAVHGARP